MINGLADVEFSVFSQFGDDGIIQWLIHRLSGLSETFVEFGVGDYRESNTRFLLLNDNWRGLVMDSSDRNVAVIKRDDVSWRHDLQSACAFVTVENINQLMLDHGFEGEIGLLHSDIDGNDYWVWRGLTAVRPAIAIMEYNSVFGAERAITIPCDPNFSRVRINNLYFGASLPAMCYLANSKGYDFVGSNSAGEQRLVCSLRPAARSQGPDRCGGLRDIQARRVQGQQGPADLSARRAATGFPKRIARGQYPDGRPRGALSVDRPLAVLQLHASPSLHSRC